MKAESAAASALFLFEQRMAFSGFLKSLDEACQSCGGEAEQDGAEVQSHSRAVLESEGRRAVLFLEQKLEEWHSALQLPPEPPGASSPATPAVTVTSMKERLQAMGAKPAVGQGMVLPALTPEQRSKVEAKVAATG